VSRLHVDDHRLLDLEARLRPRDPQDAAPSMATW
jgi:hypothetical protein